MGVLLTQSSGSNLSHIYCVFQGHESFTLRPLIDYHHWIVVILVNDWHYFVGKKQGQLHIILVFFHSLYYWKNHKSIFHFHSFFSDSAYRFFGNQTHTDYFKLLRKDGQSLLIGARNVIYNISLPYLTENVEQVRKKNFSQNLTLKEGQTHKIH